LGPASPSSLALKHHHDFTGAKFGHLICIGGRRERKVITESQCFEILAAWKIGMAQEISIDLSQKLLHLLILKT
jgi:hypothetical protein